MQYAKDLRKNSLDELKNAISRRIYEAVKLGGLYLYLNPDDILLINLNNHPEKDKVIEALLKYEYRIDATQSGGVKISW